MDKEQLDTLLDTRCWLFLISNKSHKVELMYDFDMQSIELKKRLKLQMDVCKNNYYYHFVGYCGEFRGAKIYLSPLK